MTKLKKGHYTTKARTAGAFVLLSRLPVVLLAAMVFLAPPAHVLAQQSAQSGTQAQGATKASATEDNAIRPFLLHILQRPNLTTTGVLVPRLLFEGTHTVGAAFLKHKTIKLPFNSTNLSGLNWAITLRIKSNQSDTLKTYILLLLASVGDAHVA